MTREITRRDGQRVSQPTSQVLPIDKPQRPQQGQRVTDEMVRSALTWARNYGEIVSYKSITARGRRWRIELPAARSVSGSRLHWMTHSLRTGEPRPESVVPKELVLTSREALAFAYGCAAGGIHDRTKFARTNWGWDDEDNA